MRHIALPQIGRRRVAGAIGATVVLCIALGGPPEPARAGGAAAVDPNTVATVTGGGTVVVTTFVGSAVASFGLNAKRPATFTGGTATGRINYDKHVQGTGRHVNAPVVLMQAEISSTPTPNGTGGRADLVADCNTPGSECPSGTISVVVHVEDNSDAGGGSDIFRIFFCSVPPILPPPGFDSTMPPNGCSGPDGGLLRTGNIQIRATGPSGSAGTAPTAARAPLRLP